MNDLISAPAFDFSSYQPGDVLVISDFDIAMMVPAAHAQLWKTIRSAAAKHRLNFTIERDIASREWRIRFEPAP